MPIPFFRCERCGRLHDTEPSAIECEASHLDPVSVSVKQFTHRPYPYALYVTFTDGITKIYNAEEMGG